VRPGFRSARIISIGGSTGTTKLCNSGNKIRPVIRRGGRPLLVFSASIYENLLSSRRRSTILRCYCDENYDKDSRIYSIAGFLARDREWTRVAREWKNRCLKSRVHAYHEADVEGRFGDYAHLSQQEVIELNTDLVSFLASYKHLIASGRWIDSARSAPRGVLGLTGLPYTCSPFLTSAADASQ
jgi:hypothetical protein